MQVFITYFPTIRLLARWEANARDGLNTLFLSTWKQTAYKSCNRFSAAAGFSYITDLSTMNLGQ